MSVNTLKTNTVITLVSTTTNADGGIQLPAISNAPNRVLYFKDFAGGFTSNNFTLIANSSDVFEHGIQELVLSNNYDCIGIYADPTRNIWVTLSGPSSNWSHFSANNTVNFNNNETSNNIFNVYTNIGSSYPYFQNGLCSFCNYFSYYNSNVGGPPRAIAADWSKFIATQDIDMNNYGINNLDFLQTYSLNLQTNSPYYANMSLSYMFAPFPDPMNNYSDAYEILKFNGQPFAMLNANTTGLFTLPNLYSLVFPDSPNYINTYLYNDSNNGYRFYYNVYDYDNNTTLNNRAIAQDWSFYPAENPVNMNSNVISNIDGVETTYIVTDILASLSNIDIKVYSPLNMSNNPISNVSTIEFYDVAIPSSNTTLHTSNTLLYYNNSNEIIGGTLQYLPQLLSFALPLPPFEPSQIANLALWLDGNDATTFTLDAGNITQWNDKSSNVNNFTPSYGNTAYSNGSVFNGDSILISALDLTFDTNTYVFMVASLVVTGTGDLVRMSFATMSDYSMRYYDNVYAPLGGGADILLSFNANGIPYGPIDYTQTHIIDGAFSSSGTSVMQLSSGFNGRFFTGGINEIIVYNGPAQITNDQILQVRTYLANKWAITL